MTRLISYAQNFEDVILWRALGKVSNGRYIDIGAQSPQQDSISRVFHEQGWHGIHVEPSLRYANELREQRPDDTVLQCAISDEPGVVRFFEIADTGLSTMEQAIAKRHAGAGYATEEITVVAITLDALLEQVDDGKPVHWLKIDVEGAEKSVLQGWKESTVRPWVVLLESTSPLGKEPTHGSWEPLLLAKGYRFVYFDGINRFYVSERHPELMPAFESGPNIFDNFSLSSASSFSAAVNLAYHELELRSQAREAELQAALEVTTQHLEAERQCLAEVQALRQAEQAQFNDEREQQTRELDRLQEELQVEVQAHAERTAELAESVAQAVQLEEEIAFQRRALTAATQQATALEDELDKRVRDVQRMEQATRVLRGDLTAADQRIHELAHQAHRWWVEAESLRAQLQQVLGSNSWRMTASLRAARRRAGQMRQAITRSFKRIARPVLVTGIRSVSHRPRLYQWLKPKLARVPAVNRRLVALAEQDRTLAHLAPPVSLLGAPDHIAPIYLDVRARAVLSDIKEVMHKESAR